MTYIFYVSLELRVPTDKQTKNVHCISSFYLNDYAYFVITSLSNRNERWLHIVLLMFQLRSV